MRGAIKYIKYSVALFGAVLCFISCQGRKTCANCGAVVDSPDYHHFEIFPDWLMEPHPVAQYGGC
jgi:hypothetical protein